MPGQAGARWRHTSSSLGASLPVMYRRLMRRPPSDFSFFVCLRHDAHVPCAHHHATSTAINKNPGYLRDAGALAPACGLRRVHYGPGPPHRGLAPGPAAAGACVPYTPRLSAIGSRVHVACALLFKHYVLLPEQPGLPPVWAGLLSCTCVRLCAQFHSAGASTGMSRSVSRWLISTVELLCV